MGLKPQQHTLRGKLLINWIPAFADTTDFRSNGKSGFKSEIEFIVGCALR
jgi:hypothetical protein